MVYPMLILQWQMKKMGNILQILSEQKPPNEAILWGISVRSSELL